MTTTIAPVTLIPVQSTTSPRARIPDYVVDGHPGWRIQKKRTGGCHYGPKRGWWQITFEGNDLRGLGVEELKDAAKAIAFLIGEGWYDAARYYPPDEVIDD